MLPTKFQFIWPSGFRGEDFFKSTNQKQELPMAAMFVNRSGQNDQSLGRTFHSIFASQGLQSALLIFTLGIVKTDFRGHTVTVYM